MKWCQGETKTLVAIEEPVDLGILRLNIADDTGVGGPPRTPVARSSSQESGGPNHLLERALSGRPLESAR